MRDDAAPGPLTPASAPQAPARLGREDPRNFGIGPLQLPEVDRARAVVVGGGITGASVAYHLAKAGWRATVLGEKDELTSGSTCPAARPVTQFNPSPPMRRFPRLMNRLYH